MDEFRHSSPHRAQPRPRPTQLIVLSLPACVVVVDAAPDGDTEVIARGPLSGHLRPVLGPYCSTPVVVPAGERVELRLGDETTIFVGQAPAARPASARAAHTEWFSACEGMPRSRPLSTPRGGGFSESSFNSRRDGVVTALLMIHFVGEHLYSGIQGLGYKHRCKC